jgi:hypothetical protein
MNNCHQNKKGYFSKKQPFTITNKNRDYFLEASSEALRNSFSAFSIAKDVFLARCPAALFPLSTWELASFPNSANSWAKFSVKFFIVVLFKIHAKIMSSLVFMKFCMLLFEKISAISCDDGLKILFCIYGFNKIKLD